MPYCKKILPVKIRDKVPLNIAMITRAITSYLINIVIYFLPYKCKCMGGNAYLHKLIDNFTIYHEPWDNVKICEDINDQLGIILQPRDCASLSDDRSSSSA